MRPNCTGPVSVTLPRAMASREKMGRLGPGSATGAGYRTEGIAAVQHASGVSGANTIPKGPHNLTPRFMHPITNTHKRIVSRGT
jgi:hypothetical protein